MANINYFTTVSWNDNIKEVGTDQESLAVNAIATIAGAPANTPDRWRPGAIVQNEADTLLYRNAGSTSAPSWVVVGGGAGNPAPPVEGIQYNIGGSFAADANFTTDGSTDFNLVRVPQAGYTGGIALGPTPGGSSIPGTRIFWGENATDENVQTFWGDLSALAPGVDVGYATIYDDGIGDVTNLQAIVGTDWIILSSSTVLQTQATIQVTPSGNIDLGAASNLGGWGIEIDHANGIRIVEFGGADWYLPTNTGAASTGDVLTYNAINGTSSWAPASGSLALGSFIGGVAPGDNFVLYAETTGALYGDANFVRNSTTQNTRITTAPGADTAETEWTTSAGLQPLIRNTAITAGFEVNEFIGQNGSGHRWEVQAINTASGSGVYQTQGDDTWVLTGSNNGSFSNFIDSAQEFNRQHSVGANILVTELMNTAGFGWNTGDTGTGYGAVISMTNNANGIIMIGSGLTGAGSLALQNAQVLMSYTAVGGDDNAWVRLTQNTVALGDVAVNANGTRIIIDDQISNISMQATGVVEMGDILGSGNSVRLTVDDANYLYSLNNGIFRGNQLHNNGSVAQGNATQQDIRSGTLIPTLTGVLNVTSVSSQDSQWTRVGNVVHVAGTIQVEATADNADTQVRISLPVPSDLPTTYYLSGVAHAEDTSTAAGAFSGVVLADTVNKEALLKYYNTGGTGVNNVRYMFTYTVIDP